MRPRLETLTPAFLIDCCKRFSRDTGGVTAIEYALIAAGVFLGIVGPVASMADKMDLTYGAILGYFN